MEFFQFMCFLFIRNAWRYDTRNIVLYSRTYLQSISLLIRTNYRLIVSQPIYTQRLLVLLIGTFRVIASNSERAGTGMSSEAIGVSVAPSFFQSCVSAGKTARMEDVLRYKVINTYSNSRVRYDNIMIFLIDGILILVCYLIHRWLLKS